MGINGEVKGDWESSYAREPYGKTWPHDPWFVAKTQCQRAIAGAIKRNTYTNKSTIPIAIKDNSL